jgi:predicted DNA-binding antitoxin AbrB/MazE fold protein
MKGLEIEAVYENSTLKLPRELPLQEGQKVTITIHSLGDGVERLYGLVAWDGDREEFDRWLNDPDEGQWGTVTSANIPACAASHRLGWPFRSSAGHAASWRSRTVVRCVTSKTS